MELPSTESRRAGLRRVLRRSPKKSPLCTRRSAAPALLTKSPQPFASWLHPRLPTLPDKSWLSMAAISCRKRKFPELPFALAGISMGGLVGGFYATGMSPDELKTLIEGMDWRKILGDRTPYEDLSFRRKEDQRAYANSLIFGLRGGLRLPAGLNAGHQIGLII